MKHLDLPELSDKPKHDLHFDYKLQVYILDGIIQGCNHPDSMKTNGPCCNQDKLKGQSI